MNKMEEFGETLFAFMIVGWVLWWFYYEIWQHLPSWLTYISFLILALTMLYRHMKRKGSI